MIKFKPTEEIREIRKRKESAAEDSVVEWTDRGLPMFKSPESDIAYPQIPINLTDLSEKSLEYEMVKFRRWDSYVSEQAIIFKLLVNSAKAEFKAVHARLIHEWGDSEPSMEKRKTFAPANAEYMAAEERYEKARHMYEMIMCRHTQLYSDLAVVSRVIELRKLEKGGRFVPDFLEDEVAPLDDKY